MAARQCIVGGNWKMNTNRASASALAKDVGEACSPSANGVAVVVFPPFPYLMEVAETLVDTGIEVGAQDVFAEPEGAFTGEVSVSMLQDCGCSWVLCGHSERRHVMGEPDDLVNRKVLAALAGGLKVILCVGETQAQREAGQTDAINDAQLRAGLNTVDATGIENIVIAYEPVWAIGTGLTATPEDAQSAHAAIRATLADVFSESAADGVRIQYGGSMKPGNAAELLSQPDIDGGLIGGAALKAADFAQIVAAGA